MLTHSAYVATPYFRQLDGLRAVSILLVLAIHSQVTQLRFLNGYVGVTMFFVISGYLITTLLLREAALHGRVSIGGFFIRRVFRIFPLYYLAVAVYMAVVFLGFGDDPDVFTPRLVLFLAYLGELTPPGTFGHSWSLAIEEKFYLVWPVVAFAVPALWRWRPWIGGGFAAIAAISGLWGGYMSMYAPIAFGCLVAMGLHDERWFARLRRLAHPALGIPICLATVGVLLGSTEDSHIQVPFALAAALCLPFLLIGPVGGHAWLTARPMVFIGRRAYAIYLFQPVIGGIIGRVVPPTALPWTVVHLALMTAGSLVLASLLLRFVEVPLIRVGRRLTGSMRPVERLPAVV